MAKWAELESELKAQLQVKTHPIGYKRFGSPQELDGIPDLHRMERFFVFCQMIARARKLGVTLGATNTDRMNSHCARIHGLKAVPPGMEVPTHGLRWVHSWEDEKRRFKAMQRIPPAGAIALAPLSTMTFDPDVILIYGNPAQVIMIIQSLQRKEFERFQFACIGESSCSDSLAESYLTGKVKVGLPGYGERRYGQVEDDEMVIALPPGYLEKALDGFRELRATGTIFPIQPVSLDADIRASFAKAYPDDPEFKA